MSVPGTPFFFPDNTVLINLAVLDRVDLLAWFLRDRGRWCASVEWEWRRSVGALGLQNAEQRVREICGEPLLPDPREHVDIHLLVDSLRAPGDSPDRHRGEVETIVLVRNRAELHGSVFISDDMGALQLARQELPGSKCYTTVDILVHAELSGKINNKQAHDFLCRLRQEERRVRPADASGYDAKVARLSAALARIKCQP